MDRRTFIKRLLAGGATLGAGLTLSSLFRESKAVPVPIPALREHVRHGLLAPEQADNLWPGPKWVTQLQRDRFFADGISASPNDLFFANMKLGDQDIGLILKDKQVSCTAGARHRNFDLVSDKAVLCLRQEPYRVHALRVRNGVKIPEASLGREVLVYNLSGEARIGTQTVHGEQALYFKRPQEIRVKGEQGTILVLVSKT